MPELVEVDIYRRSLEPLIGRTISGVEAPDDWFLKGGTTSGGLVTALNGEPIVGVRRTGKLLLVDVGATTLGLRFGMTGRIQVGGRQPIEELLYSTSSTDERFVRFRLTVDDGTQVAIIDPRRLGGVELAPDEGRLGPDAAAIGPADLAGALRGKRAVKAILLDQARVAGIGNLICDETLWRAGVAPNRPGSSFNADETEHLATAIRSTVADLLERGGSHLGDLQEFREPGAMCPLDGAPLVRSEIGGRTTYWCRQHQT